MKITLPILSQTIQGDQVISTETEQEFELDTSVYSEERWEQHFPIQAAKEGLYQYIERIHTAATTSERVRVASMLKAIYCFIESSRIPTYKDFAMLFNLAAPDYTEKLIRKLHNAFKLVLNGSSVKN